MTKPSQLQRVKGEPMRLPHGAYTRIANRLRPKPTAEAVRRVHLGLSPSARIQRAIDNYIARLERQGHMVAREQ